MPPSLQEFFGQLETWLDERQPEPPLRALKALCTTPRDSGYQRTLRHAAIELLAQLNDMRQATRTRSADAEAAMKETQAIVAAVRSLVADARDLDQQDQFTDALVANAWRTLELYARRAAERATDGANGVFMSYRRFETEHIAGRIHDRLRLAFPTVSIFRDVDGIPSGADFPDRIMTEIAKSRVCLVLIGPSWLSCTDPDTGCRRLDVETDWVRKEVETALTGRRLTIPVLVDGTKMPAPAELPGSIGTLAHKHSVGIRADPQFDNDVALLVRRLQEFLP